LSKITIVQEEKKNNAGIGFLVPAPVEEVRIRGKGKERKDAQLF